MGAYKQKATQALRDNRGAMDRPHGEGLAWGWIGHALKEALPQDMDDLDQFAFRFVAEALTRLFGPEGEGWSAERRADGKMVVKAR